MISEYPNNRIKQFIIEIKQLFVRKIAEFDIYWLLNGDSQSARKKTAEIFIGRHKFKVIAFCNYFDERKRIAELASINRFAFHRDWQLKRCFRLLVQMAIIISLCVYTVHLRIQCNHHDKFVHTASEFFFGVVIEKPKRLVHLKYSYTVDWRKSS